MYETGQKINNSQESIEFFRDFFKDTSITSNDVIFKIESPYNIIDAEEDKEFWILRNYWAVDKNGNLYEKRKIGCL